MTYFDKVKLTIVNANAKSLKEGKGKAWDNVKGKNRKRYVPRGKVFDRLEQIQRTVWWEETKTEIDSLIDKLKT